MCMERSLRQRIIKIWRSCHRKMDLPQKKDYYSVMSEVVPLHNEGLLHEIICYFTGTIFLKIYI